MCYNANVTVLFRQGFEIMRGVKMKKMTRIFALLLLLGCFVALVACGESEQFGLFDSDGAALSQAAEDAITAKEAQTLINTKATENGIALGKGKTSLEVGGMPLPSDTLVNGFMAEYSSCTVTTTYHNDDGMQTSSKVYRSEELLAMLSENSVSPFTDFVLKYVVAFPELIDYMELQNKAFTQSEEYLFAPVKSLFSYYTDSDGNLVVHINNFENIKPAEGIAGGINGDYRQEIELVYDEYNKLVSWQMSMGIVTKFPEGDLASGCVMQVAFDWEEKK